MLRAELSTGTRQRRETAMRIITVYEPKQLQTVYTDIGNGMAKVDTYKAGRFVATEQIARFDASMRIYEARKQELFIQITDL
jgi:hypothetical protein